MMMRMMKGTSHLARSQLHTKSNHEVENINDYDEPDDLDLEPVTMVRSKSASPSPLPRSIYNVASPLDTADPNDGYEIPVPCSKRSRPIRNKSNPKSKTNLRPGPNMSQSDDDLMRERTSSSTMQTTDLLHNRGRSCSPRWRTLPPIPVSDPADLQTSGYSLAVEPASESSPNTKGKSTLTRQRLIYPRKGSAGEILTPFSHPRKLPPQETSIRSTPSFNPAGHRELFGSGAHKKKADEGLKQVRPPSTVSENFEDALEYLPEDWAPSVPRRETGRRADGGNDSKGNTGTGVGNHSSSSKQREQNTGGDYEQAWDLNQGLERRLRSLRLMQAESDSGGRGEGGGGGAANYQEPWDSAKKQQELEERIHHAQSGKGDARSGKGDARSGKSEGQSQDQGCTSGSQGQGCTSGSQGQGRTSGSQRQAQQRVGVDAYEDAWDMKKGLSEILMSTAAQGMEDSMRSRLPSVSHTAPTGQSSSVGKPTPPACPLEDQPWYHGNISRDDAEKMLMVCKDSSFLIRDSSDRCHYTMSIRSTRQTIHIQIDQKVSAEGAMCYILGKNSPVFHTIPSMMHYYSHHPVPLKGAEHITLLYPVYRPGSRSPETRL